MITRSGSLPHHDAAASGHLEILQALTGKLLMDFLGMSPDHEKPCVRGLQQPCSPDYELVVDA